MTLMRSRWYCAKHMTRKTMPKLNKLIQITNTLANSAKISREINESNSVITSLAAVFAVAAKKLGIDITTNETKSEVIASNKAIYRVSRYDLQFSNGRKLQLFFDPQSYAEHPNRIMVRIYDRNRENLPYLVPIIDYIPEKGTFVYHPDIDFDQLAIIARNEAALKQVKWVEPFTLDSCKKFITAGIA